MKIQKSYNSVEFIGLLREFIQANIKRNRIQKNGRSISMQTLKNYNALHRLLTGFLIDKDFKLEITAISGKNYRQFLKQKKHWQQFYLKFTDYMYDDCGHFDNYVGSIVKLLKSFCQWVVTEKGINIGTFYKSFYAPKEDIPIIVLQPEQLNFLINNKQFDENLPLYLRNTKDFFVFGCTVGLRVSDLQSLKRSNLEIVGNNYYLKVYSKKNSTYTKLKLPLYAIDLINRNRLRYSSGKNVLLFPSKSLVNLNKQIKTIMELAGWDYSLTKTRMRRGRPIEVYKNVQKSEHYRFCDLITTHTMRRTAITTLLSLGMDEPSVRKISGHAPGSVEFYKYVKYNQQNLDEKTDLAFEKLQKMG